MVEGHDGKKIILRSGVADLLRGNRELEDFQALRLVQTIPLPGVKGRMDHMDADISRKRLFVAGLENGSLEVIDLAAGKWVASIPGFKKPQGVWYVGAREVPRRFFAPFMIHEAMPTLTETGLG